MLLDSRFLFFITAFAGGLFCGVLATLGSFPKTPPKPPEAGIWPEPGLADKNPVRAILAPSRPLDAVVQAEVTAYCPNRCCCGVWADESMITRTTASGAKLADLIARGRGFCAAPKEIPFGTVIYIPGYGRVPVLDRGGAIHNRDGLLRLDVFFPDHQTALEWGRRKITVEFLAVP